MGVGCGGWLFVVGKGRMGGIICVLPFFVLG